MARIPLSWLQLKREKFRFLVALAGVGFAVKVDHDGKTANLHAPDVSPVMQEPLGRPKMSLDCHRTDHSRYPAPTRNHEFVAKS